MPRVTPTQPAILAGTKLFKARLLAKRLTSKVNRLESVLEAAQDDLDQAQNALEDAQDAVTAAERQCSVQDREIAQAIETAYFADRD